MKICIIGYSGFLGSYILKKLSKKFFIIKINLREMPEFDDKNFKNFLNKFNKSNIIINCAAALKPRSKRDFFINQDFPKTLSLHMKKRKKKFLFIHMSTINVLIKDRKDSYTISKRIAEKKLLNTNATILRLPLLIKKKNGFIQKGGNLSMLFNYLNLNFLPFYPMIFPGHTFKPVTLDNIIKLINKIILKKNKIKKLYNISGKNKKTLWDLFKEIAKYENKKIIKLNLSKFIQFLPSFFKESLKKSPNFLQQLLTIDNSKYTEKKTIL